MTPLCMTHFLKLAQCCCLPPNTYTFASLSHVPPVSHPTHPTCFPPWTSSDSYTCCCSNHHTCSGRAVRASCCDTASVAAKAWARDWLVREAWEVGVKSGPGGLGRDCGCLVDHPMTTNDSQKTHMPARMWLPTSHMPAGSCCILVTD